MENKKNTILLTVIAVATLLVAVVGATFAYFTASGGATTNADVLVKTGTASSATFGTYSAISLYADEKNFAQGKKDVSGSTTGTVSWTAPGSTAEYNPTETERSLCYKVEFKIDNNTFVKSAENTAPVNELEYTVTKKAQSDSAATTVADKISLVDLTTGVAKTGVLTIAPSEKIIAEAGKTSTVDWTITVTLKNQDFNQNDNAGKAFGGSVVFTKIACA